MKKSSGDLLKNNYSLKRTVQETELGSRTFDYLEVRDMGGNQQKLALSQEGEESDGSMEL